MLHLNLPPARFDTFNRHQGSTTRGDSSAIEFSLKSYLKRLRVLTFVVHRMLAGCAARPHDLKLQVLRHMLEDELERDDGVLNISFLWRFGTSRKDDDVDPCASMMINAIREVYKIAQRIWTVSTDITETIRS